MTEAHRNETFPLSGGSKFNVLDLLARVVTSPVFSFKKLYEDPSNGENLGEVLMFGMGVRGVMKGRPKPSGIVGARMTLAEKWGVATEYVDFSEAVYTQTLKAGTDLIQYRVKGNEGSIGNYYAKPGTTPESIGIPSSAVGET